jgi:hypothetical protein
MFSANEIVTLQDHRSGSWHQGPVDPAEAMFPAPPLPSQELSPDLVLPTPWPADWLRAVCCQHRANFELWHIEDEARRPNASDAELASVKRRVDATNQRRNDLAESIDRQLLAWLQLRNLPNASAPLHSESPGLIIDRLSILSLKIFHTREEAERSDAPAGHVERNQGRLAILLEQRADLAHCLESLWQETVAATRRFKLYRQLKMYNDPALNPAIYRTTGIATPR